MYGIDTLSLSLSCGVTFL